LEEGFEIVYQDPPMPARGGKGVELAALNPVGHRLRRYLAVSGYFSGGKRGCSLHPSGLPKLDFLGIFVIFELKN